MSTDIGIGLARLVAIARGHLPDTTRPAVITKLRLHVQTVGCFLAGGVVGVLLYAQSATPRSFSQRSPSSWRRYRPFCGPRPQIPPSTAMRRTSAADGTRSSGRKRHLRRVPHIAPTHRAIN
jgi:hypothetical protein